MSVKYTNPNPKSAAQAAQWGQQPVTKFELDSYIPQTPGRVKSTTVLWSGYKKALLVSSKK